MAVPTLAPRTDAEERTSEDESWACIVDDDPINTTTYVQRVFMSYFGYSSSKAYTLMMRVHTQGSAQVSTGPRERMETDVQAMHHRGLRARLEKQGGDDSRDDSIHLG
ncbi:ATP-dependent Clp protease adapter ClpS [Actinomyces vulturis]|uniref:ATP-dependent Clp protease adapter ClpS n=1 Tax=Actinomyces vulturis TaxID=1857645 RepID=UPI000834A656|nr:ATP-dependent Clp protease adapter ClpS [Actinomyces vulturis]